MQQTISVGTFTPSVIHEVCRREGALRSAGLDVEEHQVPSSPSQFSALRKGELHVALTSPDNVLAYRFAPGNPLGTTLDAKIVGSVDRGLGLGLYGRPGLATPDQLRGACVGVDVPTSGFALALYALADSLGVDREDYRVEALGSTPRRLEALLDGRCDATMLNAGNELRAAAAGCVLLKEVPEVCRPYLGTVVAVVGDENVEVAARLARALGDTSSRILDGELDRETVDAAADILGLSTDLARRYVERLKDPDHGLTGDEVDQEALSTLVDLRRRYLPEFIDGNDVLDSALDPAQGLVVDHRSLP